MSLRQPVDSRSGGAVGPYRLTTLLGSGGMGAVWRAWDERLKRPVAIKHILPEVLGKPSARARFRREAEAQAVLNHPSIAHIYDILETDQGDWIVMELIEGEPLSRSLRPDLLDLPRVVRLAREIAEGLAEAHAHGIIHRDLKASNVMVTATGHAKILDFGIAKLVEPDDPAKTLSEPGLVVGTSYAMSPEQVQGLAMDFRSDLFSLGSLLYEMVTGVAPFRADTATAMMVRVCSFRPEPARRFRPEVPRELSDLIDYLLEKNPFHRPQSTVEVVRMLESLDGSGGRFPVLEETTVADGYRAFAEPPVDDSEPRPSGMVPAKLRRAGLWAGLILLLAIAGSSLIPWKAAPTDPYTLYREGQAYLSRYDRKGNLDHAIESFQRVLAQDDHHAAAHAALAKAYWLKHMGESKDPIWLDRALPMARRSVALDNDLAMSWVSLGLVNYSTGKLDDAERDFDQALRLEPLNADAYYGLGQVYEAQTKIQAAEAAQRKAIEIHPDRLYYDELGSLYYRTRRTQEAIRAFKKSIELAPDSFRGYRNLGAAYYAQGDLDQAAAQFQKALEIQPDSTLYGNLGSLDFARGFYPQAVDAFEKALAMPGGANSYLQWGNLGDACRWTPDKKERAREAYLRGIQLIREELRSHPEDLTLHSRLALYLAKRGDRAEALTELARLEATAGKDASADYRMAVAYEAIEVRDKALAALGRALREGFPGKEIRMEPELLGLRADPRYHKLIAALGTP